MHLVFISTLYNPLWGGSEILWSSAALRALEGGHKVSVFISEREKLEPPLERLKRAGARLFFWKHKYSPLNFIQRLNKKLSGRGLPEWEWWHGNLPKDADVICLSQGGAVCGLIRHGLSEAIISTGIPYFVLARADGGIEYLTDATRPRVKTFLENAKGYISASRSTIELVRLHIPSALNNAQVLHSPILDLGDQLAPYPKDDPFRFACVGSLRMRKGQHLMLACLAEEQWGARNWKLMIYGDGPERQYLKRLVDHFKLNDKVVLAGHTSNLAEVWSQAHLAIQPSFMEGAPQSLLEAMLCRRACVATAVSGIPEWVEEGKTGFLAEAPTVNHLRAALERAWENRHRWAEVGDAARAACLAKRDPDPAGTLLRLLKAVAKA
jgi:glycosyltransferase involved in cell wall biosynthesis